MKVFEASSSALKSKIQDAAILSGFHKPIEEDYYKSIVEPFLIRMYASFNLEDITEAFMLYAARELEYKDKAFELMSPLFIGGVMSSYKKYKQEKNKIKKIEPKELNQLNEINEIDEKDQEEKAYLFIQKVFIEEGKPPLIANWKKAFNYLTKNGFIEVSKEDIEEATKQVAYREASEINKRDPFKRIKIEELLNTANHYKHFVIKYLKE